MSLRRLFSITLLTGLTLTNVLCLQSFLLPETHRPNQLVPNSNTSLECRIQLENLDNSTLFLMLDASTKLPNSPASGNHYDFGNFDQCYNLKSKTIYGKYCLGTKSYTENSTFKAKSIIFMYEPRKEGAVGLLTGLHYAICLPDKCKPDEFSSDLQYNDNFCYSKNHLPELTMGAIFTIVFLSMCLTLVTVATIYEAYLHYTNQKSNNRALLAFSAISNGSKLFKYSSHSNQLLCLNGIKALLMMWVIIGHKSSILTTTPILNAFTIFDYEKDPSSMLVVDADLAVDSFLFMSGLLATYSFLLSHYKGAKFDLFTHYLHRFLRLSPAFGVAILIHGNILKYLSDGPIWANMDATLGVKCRTEWWYDFFYIHNYAIKGGCLPQAWYLSLDMQLFLLSPLIFLTLVKNQKVGIAILSILSILGVVIPSTVAYIYKLRLLDPLNYVVYYYFPTHMRFGVYIVGIIFGYMVYKIKQNGKAYEFSRLAVISLWIICAGGLIACVYVSNLITMSSYQRLTYSLFLGVHRQLFTSCVGLLVYLCALGYGGPVNSFLSLPMFQFLTKISYSMYLLHYAVISLRYFSMRTPLYFSNYTLLTEYWGDFIFTMFLSTVFTLMFESPIAVLETYMFKRKKNREVVNTSKEPENGLLK